MQHVTNVWTIYADGSDEKTPALASPFRPQDWGHPRWMYRVYTLEAQGYRNEVHCWIDVTLKEYEHLTTFAPLICTILLPGTPRQICGRDYLRDDDFWQKSWGKRPPHFDPLDADSYTEEKS